MVWVWLALKVYSFNSYGCIQKKSERWWQKGLNFLVLRQLLKELLISPTWRGISQSFNVVTAWPGAPPEQKPWFCSYLARVFGPTDLKSPSFVSTSNSSPIQGASLRFLSAGSSRNNNEKKIWKEPDKENFSTAKKTGSRIKSWPHHSYLCNRIQIIFILLMQKAKAEESILTHPSKGLASCSFKS